VSREILTFKVEVDGKHFPGSAMFRSDDVRQRLDAYGRALYAEWSKDALELAKAGQLTIYKLEVEGIAP
jgi:hypothetical protein